MKALQLELSLGSRPRIARQRHFNRAHFWFQRMREVVDHNLAGPAAPIAPRESGNGSVALANEPEVCE